MSYNLPDLDQKSVLITGGTGSFGQTMVRSLLSRFSCHVRVYSRDEKKQEDLRVSVNSPNLETVLGDVRDIDSVQNVMHGIDYVFHAAALKQVPSCEFHPLEAVKTNVLGASNVLDAAVQSGVQSVVVLSTDKAVYPINAMGMTKALMEKLMVGKARQHMMAKTRFAATRYGNVIGSRGSVIPVFFEQISSGKPITVTNPLMTRFMMSLEESVDLVLHAFDHGSSGSIFVKDTPSCDIMTLVHAVCSIMGVENHKIRYIGNRHGEKLHEVLLSVEEMRIVEQNGDFFRVPLDTRNLSYDDYLSKGMEDWGEDKSFNSQNSRHLTVDETIEVLKNDNLISSLLRFYL
ncbi:MULTISPECIES: polysaccharide biosynthesis protein [unclassified Roseobacter]|uniref:polysaccharide biosynthesis protein n=1 Tax=unclassified Roseobacter TaxID=196798 RepID=UPI0030EF45B3